jgi:hypothetical protein
MVPCSGGAMSYSAKLEEKIDSATSRWQYLCKKKMF